MAICSLFALACIATSQGQQRMLPNTTGVSQIETEMVTISPAGAEPKAITREATPFFLYVKLAENFAPQADLTIVPATPLPDGRQLSGIVNQQALARTHRSAGPAVLPPGDYYLQSASAHTTLCTITIKAGS